MPRQLLKGRSLTDRQRSYESWYQNASRRFRNAGFDLGLLCAGHSIRKRRDLAVEDMTSRDLRHWVRWIRGRARKLGINPG